MAGFVRIRQVESRANLSFGRTLRLSSDRHDLIPPPLSATNSAITGTTNKQRKNFLDFYAKNRLITNEKRKNQIVSGRFKNQFRH